MSLKLSYIQTCGPDSDDINGATIAEHVAELRALADQIESGEIDTYAAFAAGPAGHQRNSARFFDADRTLHVAVGMFDLGLLIRTSTQEG